MAYRLEKFWGIFLGILLSWVSIGVYSFANEAISSYQIGPQDRIRVDIWQESDLTGIYSVTKDGLLIINWVEPLPVRGLTLEEAKAKITQTIKKYIRNPVVTVTIAEYRSQTITVLGEVRKPGQFYLKNDNSLLNFLLNEAGGATSSAGDNISIIRFTEEGDKTNSKTITIQLSQLFQGDPKQNISLQHGDTIMVSRFDSKGVGTASGNQVLVVGEVAKEGSYQIRDGYTVLNAVLDAGGFTKYASPNRVKVFRGSGDDKEEFTVRLKDVMGRGEKSKDLNVEPGDLIRVPKSIL